MPCHEYLHLVYENVQMRFASGNLADPNTDFN